MSPLFIPPELIITIWSAEIGDSFILALKQLANLLKLESTNKGLSNRMAEEMEPLLLVLRDKVLFSLEFIVIWKAIHKLRTFLYTRIHTLSIPNTNLQVRQDVLLKHMVIFY